MASRVSVSASLNGERVEPRLFNAPRADEGEILRLLMTLRRRGITSTDVLSAIERVPRDRFVPEAFTHCAYEDVALPIENDQAISQPSVVAQMTEALDVETRHKVLEVGTGTGYQAAILSRIARRVYTVERDRAILRHAERRLNQLGFHSVVTRLGDGRGGWPEQAPFDRIMVTAAAEEVPQALTEQLAPGGILVMPVGPVDGEQKIMRFAHDQGRLSVLDLGPVTFVPLLSGLAQAPGRSDLA